MCYRGCSLYRRVVCDLLYKFSQDWTDLRGIWCWGFNETPSRNLKLVQNLAISGTVSEDLGTLLLVTAMRNILSVDNSARGKSHGVSVAILKGFVLSTVTRRSITMQMERIVVFPYAFHSNSGSTKASYVAPYVRTLYLVSYLIQAVV